MTAISKSTDIVRPIDSPEIVQIRVALLYVIEETQAFESKKRAFDDFRKSLNSNPHGIAEALNQLESNLYSTLSNILPDAKKAGEYFEKLHENLQAAFSLTEGSKENPTYNNNLKLFNNLLGFFKEQFPIFSESERKYDSLDFYRNVNNLKNLLSVESAFSVISTVAKAYGADDIIKASGLHDFLKEVKILKDAITPEQMERISKLSEIIIDMTKNREAKLNIQK